MLLFTRIYWKVNNELKPKLSWSLGAYVQLNREQVPTQHNNWTWMCRQARPWVSPLRRLNEIPFFPRRMLTWRESWKEEWRRHPTSDGSTHYGQSEHRYRTSDLAAGACSAKHSAECKQMLLQARANVQAEMQARCKSVKRQSTEAWWECHRSMQAAVKKLQGRTMEWNAQPGTTRRCSSTASAWKELLTE